MAVLIPKVSNAQAYQYGTPAPEVTAGTAGWQAQSAPIIVNGLVYFPTRAFRLFDANVMMQSGIYEGVPVYADVTLEPYSLVYVPVSRSNMRVYEHKRDGALAGTTGSRTPSFPVEIASDTVLAQTQRAAEASAMAAVGATGSGTPGVVGTSGSAAPRPASTSGVLPDVPRPQRTRVGIIPGVKPSGPNGVWLEFGGTRWYADGAAVPFSPDRFEPIGEYRGFPVYRDKEGKKNEIWVSVVKDGPVAPYTKR